MGAFRGGGGAQRTAGVDEDRAALQRVDRREGFVGPGPGGGRVAPDSRFPDPLFVTEDSQGPRMDQIQLGSVTVTRVREYFGPVGLTPGAFFPESPDEVWKDGGSWPAPHFLDPAAGMVQCVVQTWVLRSEGRTVLVDTGVGNHKERPGSPVWHHLETEFLADLARAGVRPEDVDIVINTHLHNDHVGWNTRLEGTEWVPTFPRATYLVPKADFDHWNPADDRTERPGAARLQVFEDSVAPVHRAGQTVLWEGSHRIDAALRLDAAPGHTPGSSVLTLTSGTDRAVFVGDGRPRRPGVAQRRVRRHVGHRPDHAVVDGRLQLPALPRGAAVRPGPPLRGRRPGRRRRLAAPVVHHAAPALPDHRRDHGAADPGLAEVFDQVYLLTKGGPNGSTRPVVEYIYDVGFTGYRLGYASAISYIFFALVPLASAVQYAALRRREK